MFQLVLSDKLRDHLAQAIVLVYSLVLLGVVLN